jgi:prefoldin subunit 5
MRHQWLKLWVVLVMIRVMTENPQPRRVDRELEQRSRSIGAFFETVHQDAAATVLANREQWPAMVRTADTTLIEGVVRKKDFGQTEGTSPLYGELVSLSRQRERVARKKIKQTIEGENDLGLSETEKTVLSAHCDLGEHFDELYVQWREKTQHEPDDTNAKVDERDSLYMYAVGESGTDGTKLVPYATAFPEPIAAIDERVSELITALETLDTTDADREALITYYRSMQKAITSKDMEQHEALFREVDINWMKIKGRMQPIHMSETQVESKKRVIPDLALSFLDDREEALNEKMQAMNEPLAHAIREVGSYPESAETQSQVGVYTGIGSGMRLDFDPAGQILPERYDLRLQEGIKMFMNLKKTRDFRENYRALMQEKFGGTTIDDDALVTARTLFNSGHERAHSAFARSTDAMEEIKADITTLMAVPELHLDEQERDAMITSLLGTSLFYLHAAKGAGLPEYYSSGSTVLRAMIDAGVIKRGASDQLSIDLSPDAKQALYRRSKEIALEVNDVCVLDDATVRETFLARYASEPDRENEKVLTSLAA